MAMPRYDFQARASEVDPRAREHPEIGFVLRPRPLSWAIEYGEPSFSSRRRVVSAAPLMPRPHDHAPGLSGYACSPSDAPERRLSSLRLACRLPLPCCLGRKPSSHTLAWRTALSMAACCMAASLARRRQPWMHVIDGTRTRPLFAGILSESIEKAIEHLPGGGAGEPWSSRRTRSSRAS